MSESIEHMNLVKDIVEYVKEKLPECVHGLIEIDDCIAQKPPKINGFIPDVYFNWKEQLIIGEAKTLADFERKHSREQFMTYLEACPISWNSNAYCCCSVAVKNDRKELF